MFRKSSINALRESIEKGEPVTGPLDVQILPTPRCNASCVFCPLNAIPPPLMQYTPRFCTYEHDLPGGLLDRLADDLYHLGGLERLTITGGEPLLYRYLIPAVFQFRNSFPEAELTVVTNGIRLIDFADFFVGAGLQNLTVSINAGTRETYLRHNPGASGEEFDRIVEGVTAVTNKRDGRDSDSPRVTLSVVLTKDSASEVGPVFEIGRSTASDAVTFLPLMEIRLQGRSVNRGLRAGGDEFNRFLGDMERYSDKARQEGFYMGYAGSHDDAGVVDQGGLYKDQPCYAGYAFAAVYPNGDVRPCCHCEPIMGNLTRSSFIDIWRSERYAEQRARMMAIQESPQALEGCLCDECGYLFENRELHKKLST